MNESVKTCRICKNSRLELAWIACGDITFNTTSDVFDYYRCMECNCLNIYPLPLETQLSGYYRNYYTKGSQKSSAFKKKWLKLKQQFIEYCQSDNPSLIERLLFGLLLKNKMISTLRYQPISCSPARVLDVGYGDASFLILSKRLGHEVYGYEFDQQLNSKAREYGIRIIDDPTQSTDYQEFFDYVSLNHVVEHVTDPYEFLQCLVMKTKTDGKIFLETPNVESITHKIFGQYWRGLEAPRHLHLLSEAGILRIAERLKIKAVQLPESIVNFPSVYLASLKIYLNQDKKRNTRKCARAIGYILLFPVALLVYFSSRKTEMLRYELIRH